ncbi:MAG TPA: response regulator transcription factor [Anaerolineales bacterium]|nr:response regulator transcription factor [Anaerolineales bacterium]
MKKIRVLLVDDHEIVRLGLATLLHEIPCVSTVGEAGSAEEAVRAVPKFKPDVVVMDIRLPGESGIEACRQIKAKYPEVNVLMLTSYAEDSLVFKALEAGASGYVLKQVGNQHLINAMEAACRGESVFDPQITQKLIDRVRQYEQAQHEGAFESLSARELEVLALIAEGKSNAQIGEKLYLSEKTVGHHVSAILGKLGVTNRIEAANFANQHHIQDLLKRD